MSGDNRRDWRSEPQVLPSDLAKAVALGGEMGRLFAEFDWVAHPLGSPAEWSAEVRSAVAVVLVCLLVTPIVMYQHQAMRIAERD